jgi:NAD(P)-dependent dehydrogenase (short-subunit alcohol dehydrogenase family)
VNGKTVLVTGATSGIGLETVRAIAGLGAHVIVGARNETRGSTVVDELRAHGGSAELLVVDVASRASIARAASRFATAHGTLDVLVNNAGMMSLKRRVGPDGHELTWATNFLGTVAITRALQTQLEATPGARVVNVSSNAHNAGRITWDDLDLERTRYSAWRAYSQSKLAVNLWTREFARRYPRIATNAVHPGAIATNIWTGLPAIVTAIVARTLPPASKGAIPVVRLATSADVEGVTGRYFEKLKDTPHAAAAMNDVDAARLWDIAEREIS